MNQSKNIIITGATGQDGSNMVDFLLKNTEHEVYGIVRRLSVPNHKNLANAISNPRFHLVSADLTDQYSLDQLVENVDPHYFINLAAQSFVAESWNTPENTFNVNTLGVLRCLEAIRRHRPGCRFYSAGSSEEWGDVKFSPQTIDHPIRPRSPYGASKASARHIVKVYRESYELYALHGILFNHEGVRRGEEFVTRKITKNVARIYHEIEQGQEIVPMQLGNIDAKRDWSDSEDFVEGIWRIINQEEFNPAISEVAIPGGSDWYNNTKLAKVIKEYVLASDETHTVREFIEKAFKAAGLTNFVWDGEGVNEVLWYQEGTGAYKLVTINPEFYRPAEVDLLIGDSSPARAELGWAPKVSFDALVKKMVEHDIHAN